VTEIDPPQRAAITDLPLMHHEDVASPRWTTATALNKKQRITKEGWENESLIRNIGVFPWPILVRKFLQGLGPAFSAWEMSFYQQHSIIGNKNTPGVTLLEASTVSLNETLGGNHQTVVLPP
jgi:hypothetical protein